MQRMATSINPIRYAQAVFLLGKERHMLDEWLADLDKLAEILEDEVILAALENPEIPFPEKEKALEPLASIVSPQAMNLVRLLLSRNCIGAAGGITREFKRMYNEDRGLEKARVITAVPLDEESAARLADEISVVLGGKKIELETEVDPSIIGGFIARVGENLLDGSIRSNLERLKRQLASGEKRR